MNSKRKYSTARKRSKRIDAMKLVYAHLSTIAARLQEDIDQCISEIKCCKDAGDMASVRDLKKRLRRLKIDQSWYVPAKTKRASPEG